MGGTNDQLVFHFGLGIAYPNGNSQVLPFEKRYFSGGANSVRGWSVRSLGPGSYKDKDGKINFITQTGDMKLDVNLEYRSYLFWKFNWALFVDAGNIWTIHEYADQAGGLFEWDQFYKQIALAYGAGIRFDLSILLLRVDFGVKLYDPKRLSDANGTQWRTAANGLCWRDDMTFHFAIGYPF